MLKRLFDIISSSVALIILSPILIIISLFIILDSQGGIFYKQIRIGKNEIPFKLFKFRTMSVGSDQKGLITVGKRDSRITKVGYYLRKYKIDELPQLLNIVLNDMSVVGPRPEVEKYVRLYTEEQKEVLKVKPGLTDLASLKYFNENEILDQTIDSEKAYVEEVMPEKLKLNLEYIKNQSFFYDLKLIILTLKRIVS
jgi:lipopolysaccharide/colanic/teichoic acid biosynthesis glycosyltransferase